MRGLALAAAAGVAAFAGPAPGVIVGQQPGVESVAIPDGAVTLRAHTGTKETSRAEAIRRVLAFLDRT